MFKLQINWKREGKWFDCVYPPASYDVSMSRFYHYTDMFPEHQYRILSMMDVK